MFCKKCGKEVKDDIKFCEFCGAPIQAGEKEVNTVQKQEESITGAMPEGKQWEFWSSRFVRLWAGGKIHTKLQVKEDKLLIDIEPEKMNTVPEIILSNIVDIKLSTRVSKRLIFFLIFFLLGTILMLLVGADNSGEALVALILVIYLNLTCINTKVRILQRNGEAAVFLIKKKAMAVAFQEDMKKIIHYHLNNIPIMNTAYSPNNAEMRDTYSEQRRK